MQENTKLQHSKNKAKVYLNSTSLSQEIYYKNSLSIANNLGICFSKKISKKMILKKKKKYMKILQGIQYCFNCFKFSGFLEYSCTYSA